MPVYTPHLQVSLETDRSSATSSKPHLLSANCGRRHATELALSCGWHQGRTAISPAPERLAFTCSSRCLVTSDRTACFELGRNRYTRLIPWRCFTWQRMCPLSPQTERSAARAQNAAVGRERLGCGRRICGGRGTRRVAVSRRRRCGRTGTSEPERGACCCGAPGGAGTAPTDARLATVIKETAQPDGEPPNCALSGTSGLLGDVCRTQHLTDLSGQMQREATDSYPMSPGVLRGRPRCSQHSRHPRRDGSAEAARPQGACLRLGAVQWPTWGLRAPQRKKNGLGPHIQYTHTDDS